MKKTVLIIALIFVTPAFSKLNIVVSIQPEIEFVQKIGGNKINSSLMVEQGSSPHTYEPKPSQMRKLSSADLYLAIGVEFEKSWLDRFKNQNNNLKIVDISKDINKTVKGKELDPHVWVAPENVKIIAKNIYKALSSIDSNNSEFYKKNLENYLKELNQVDNEIKNILKDTPKNSIFMVFHPAWGYFAKEYNLKELSVEIDGKSPKPRQLIEIIKIAKKENVKVIFTQPEFSDKSAKIIANTLHIKVIKTTPLSKNWAKNLINLANNIANRESK